MKPALFEYVRASSVEHALASLSSADDVKLIAGGQSLLPMMNLRMAAPEVLVDIDGLVELDRVVAIEEEVVIGALTRHDRLARDPVVARTAPLLAEAARHIGHLAIRNRGTIGGSLAHADPSAELPAACAVLGARAVCDRADGRRREVPVERLTRGVYSTDLEPDEMVTWIRLPLWEPSSGWGFAELTQREGDFALAGACVTVEPAAEHLRVVVFGLEPRPRVFEGSPTSLAGDASPIRDWANALRPMIDPEFRRDLAVEMIRRAGSDAMARVRGS